MLEVPPAELAAVADALEDLGTVLSFDQLAEDVTDQLADLDTRIANLRASVERVRALYAEAVDIDSIVRLEAELTRRETDLEVLLASQQALEDRVTMSTLTVDVAATPGALDADDDRPGDRRRRSAGGARSSAGCSPSCSSSPPSPRSSSPPSWWPCSALWAPPAGPAPPPAAHPDRSISERCREPESASRPG